MAARVKDGRYQVWGIEEYEEGAGIGPVLNEYGITNEQIDAMGVDPATDAGWEFPTIAHVIGDKVAGKDSPLSYFLGAIVGLSAIFSMIGLFIGNGLGGTRVPYAMAEDGMMPKFLNKVHPKFGTPWISIIICGVFYLIFSTSAFQNLVVIDVFLNMLVLMAEIFALVMLRIKTPGIAPQSCPGWRMGIDLHCHRPVVHHCPRDCQPGQGLTAGNLRLGGAFIAMIDRRPVLSADP